MKALTFAVLVAWSATIVATAVSMSEHARVFNTLNVTRTLVLSKRCLRSNENVETSKHAADSEERMNNLPADSTFLEHIEEFRTNLQNAMNTESLLLIPDMKELKENVFSSEKEEIITNFSMWASGVKSKLSKAADKVMFVMLAEHFNNNDNLAKFLVAGTRIESTKSTAESLLDILIEMRIKDPMLLDYKPNRGEECAIKAFQLLGIKGNLGSPLLSKWKNYVDLAFGSTADFVKVFVLETATEEI